MFEECKVSLSNGQLQLTSGRVTDWYYDFDLMSPRQARDAALLLVKSMPMEYTKIDFIVAPALGGVVPAYFIGEWIDKPVITVDKDGRCRGHNFLPGSNYLIIDDVVSTYSEVDRCVKIFRDHHHIGTMAYIYRGVEDMRKDTIVLDRKEPEYAKI